MQLSGMLAAECKTDPYRLLGGEDRNRNTYFIIQKAGSTLEVFRDVLDAQSKPKMSSPLMLLNNELCILQLHLGDLKRIDETNLGIVSQCCLTARCNPKGLIDYGCTFYC
ncbi:hypothetical protein L1987_02333 [Smallanthus sonchifolius]|uniref:Uncharacterized protein n=1 Tax=Smallanthus sonchifolius TaxID=185202 RepID=A0ACB9K7P9_9ASTR|nr:hypothetical protein L1987_02333 [Smallanthus sonchifolius]